jgi:nucleoside transporter
MSNPMSPESVRAGGGAFASTPRLAAMMFLQFFLWGAWFVTLGPFLAARGVEGVNIGNAYTTAPIAAILAPLFLGMVADRFFASQRVLGVLHLLGGGLLLLAPAVAPVKQGDDPWLFLAVILGHMLCYMPTLGLSNTVAFQNILSPERQFPIIRVLGTVGWIVAGVIVGLVAASMFPYGNYLPTGFTISQFEDARAQLAAMAQVPTDVALAVKSTVEKATAERNASPHFFTIAGVSGVVLGLYAFTLPHTPPPAKGKPFSAASALGLEALVLLKERSFAVFCVCSFLLCIPLAAYYSKAAEYAGAVGITDVPIKMTYGQMSEVVLMLVMPLFFRALGVKWMLAVGMLAWVVRYGLFGGAWNPADKHVQWMVLAGIILHGICYDFFFVTGQIYVEQRCSPAIRGQAQALLVLITQGLGMLAGNQIFPRLIDHYTTKVAGQADVVDYRMVWFLPAAFAGVVMLLFVALFKNERAREGDVGR